MANTDLIIRLLGDTRSLRQGLAKANSYMARFQKTTKNLGSTLGIALGGAAVFRAIGTGISIIADFEDQMAKVSAVSRASAKDLKLLSRNARDLGSVSRFTAVEIGQMQEVLARLGFESKQIINTTDAVRKLATAAGEELAPAADVMAKTLNAFNLASSQSERVANVMAESFAMTALNMEEYSVAMSFVATSAKTFGLSVERTSAMLGVLVDNGIKGTKAGSGLRDIFTDLSVKGITLQQAYDKVNASQNKVATAFDLVGKTSLNQLIILAENQTKVEKLTESFSDNTLEMNKMADTMDDTLLGAWARFKSAMVETTLEGGFFGEMLKDLLDNFSEGWNRSKQVAGGLENLEMKAKTLGIELSHLDKVTFRQILMGEAAAGKSVGLYRRIIEQFTIIAGFRQAEADYDEKQERAAKQRVIDLAKQGEELEKQRILASQFTALPAGGALKTKGADPLDTSIVEKMNAAQEKLGETIANTNAQFDLQKIKTNELMVSMDGMEQVAIDLNKVMQNFAATMAVSFGQALGDAISGTGNFGATMLASVGQFMQQLGQLMITTAIITEAFKKTLIANPIAAIAGGIALVAAGRVFANSAQGMVSNMGNNGGGSGGGGYGGPGDSRGTGNVGLGFEKRNEVQRVEIFGTIRGQDLIFAQRKADRNNGIGG